RSTGRGRDAFVSVERQHADGAERAGRAATERRAEGLGGILHHRDAVLGAESQDGVIVGAGAVEVDRHDRRRHVPSGVPLGQLGGQQGGRYLPSDGIGVDKTGAGTAVGDGVGGGRERGGGQQYVVTGADADLEQRQMQGG